MLEINQKVRTALRMNRIPVWMLADRLQCHENTLLRRLRHELPEDEQEKMVAIVEQIARKENR